MIILFVHVHPPPFEFPVKIYTFPLIVRLLRSPTPSEFLTTLFCVGMDIFGSAHTCKQGLEKVLSSRPGQVDSPSGQVKFTVTCLLGKGSGNFCAS